jgi:glucose 1-dehydrogenase
MKRKLLRSEPLKMTVRTDIIDVNNEPDLLKPLKNQKALVTGANSGIGEACVLALGSAGADVTINYVSRPDEAERVAKIIRQGGTRAITFQGR